mgnify:CR=1 FL=1
MQRRNFKMPSRNFQHSQPKEDTSGRGPNRGFARWTKGPGSGKTARNTPDTTDTAVAGQPEEETRWQDDGGESGDK